MQEKNYLNLFHAGILASLIIILFSFKGLLFPFITSKQFVFNILIEFLFALWLIFILKFPEYRPKKSLLVTSLFVYLGAILASLFVSVDFNLTLWGDAERMLGLVHITHFFLYFLILISTFKSWTDYKKLFISSVSIATLVSLMGIFGANVFSTIGNTAYVSGYLIFNIFFALILFFRENKASAWRYLYILPILIMLYEMALCRTSGAIIGLFASVLLIFFLLGVFHDRKKVKIFSISLLVVLLLAVVAVFSQQDKEWFQNSFLRNLTSQKVTFQTRLISWKGAAKDFPNHPILGTGFGTFAISFDKYFDPKFLNYTLTETYFDRAHNNLIDIASTTGALGLITYLSIFVIALIYLYKIMKSNDFKVGLGDLKRRHNLEIIIIVALLAAYFIQNLAIFDSYATYIGLMMTLAFIYYLRQEQKERLLVIAPEEEKGEIKEIKEKKEKRAYLRGGSLEVLLIIMTLLAVYLLTFFVNIQPKRMFEKTIESYSLILGGKVVEGHQLFKSALKDHPLERDARVVMINNFSSERDVFSNLNQADLEEIIDLIISIARKNLAYNPQDSLMQMQLARVLDNSFRLYQKYDEDKAREYGAEALEHIDLAIAASPGKPTTYLFKAQILLNQRQDDLAIETLKEAIALNPDYYESHCSLAQFSLFLERDDDAKESLNNCARLDGLSHITSGAFLTSAVSFFVDDNDYESAISFALRLSELYPNDANVFLNLAKIYLISGDNDKSAIYLQQAFQLDKSISSEWEDFLAYFLELD